jgi:hypothetical protein
MLGSHIFLNVFELAITDEKLLRDFQLNQSGLPTIPDIDKLQPRLHTAHTDLRLMAACFRREE